MKKATRPSILCTIVVALAIPGEARAQGIDLDAVVARIGAEATKILATTPLPSISMALVRNGDVAWAGAWGMANVAAGVPATSDTYYSTGSTFKFVTATAVMQLVEQGKVTLDSPLNEIVPDTLRIDGADDVTLRHMLSHHSGLEGPFGIVPLWSRSAPPSVDALLAKTRRVGAPGVEYRYCNECYAIAGRVIEWLSGQTWDEYVAAHILEPLGIDAAHPSVPSAAVVERLALPYGSEDGKAIPIEQVRFDVFAAGDVYLRASDMARYLAAQLGDGQYRGSRILRPESAREMRRRQFDGQAYGLGIGVSTREGHELITHNGAIPGFHSIMIGEPATGLGVYAMTNGDQGSPALGRLAMLSLALLRGEDPGPLPDFGRRDAAVAANEAATAPATSAQRTQSIEQTSEGTRAPARIVASFDGLGAGFDGPQGTANFRNPSDNSLAAGPDHIVEIVNSRMAVYTKKGAQFDTTGRVLYGPVPTNTIFEGFGGRCEPRPNGDAVVRYDQLANRWLFVMPIFRRDSADTKEPFSMCYAVSTGADPQGPYHRYEFKRALFPDYPRPAIWPDGYYVPTSTGDDIVEKHICIADRAKMLRGAPATEQCRIIEGVNFLNNADIDGTGLPPAGAPNLMFATGGTQLRGDFDDDGIYAWKVHVDWDHPERTSVGDPVKIAVAPYTYLCGGQLTSCVPQPGTDRRLDAQGDKLMNRVIYRNLGDHESIVAVHSVNTTAGGGGVRWYEFRLDADRNPVLHQQGTFAPDRFYRWMGSIGMDRMGNIAVGYSFGGTPHFAGQRFAGRLAADPPGLLTLREAILVEGEASQTNTLRWEDYTTLALDPSDDCTFWYVGDYLRAGTTAYRTRIGGFRLPGCM